MNSCRWGEGKKTKKRNRSTPSTYYLLKRKWIFKIEIDHDRLRFRCDFGLLFVFVFFFSSTFDRHLFFHLLALTDMNCGGNPCGNAVPATKHTQSAIEMKLRIFRMGRWSLFSSIIIKLNEYALNENDIVCCSHSRLFLFVQMNVLSNSFTKLTEKKTVMSNTASMKNDQPLIKFHLLLSQSQSLVPEIKLNIKR